MEKVRVIYYLNQFFAGTGGEENTGASLGPIRGVVGPGKHLQTLIESPIEIVVTVYCGDNYLNEHPDKVLTSILTIARDHNVKATSNNFNFEV